MVAMHRNKLVPRVKQRPGMCETNDGFAVRGQRDGQGGETKRARERKRERGKKKGMQKKERVTRQF